MNISDKKNTCKDIFIHFVINIEHNPPQKIKKIKEHKFKTGMRSHFTVTDSKAGKSVLNLPKYQHHTYKMGIKHGIHQGSNITNNINLFESCCEKPHSLEVNNALDNTDKSRIL